ncbi:MAG: hypothetical protein IJI60_01865 [Bacilli bacterium]|nr:hypothetical protein [Bacilli bacterium]
MRNKYVSTSLFVCAFGLLLVVAVAVAYAALTSTLTITTSQMTQQALTWSVALVPGTLTATEGGDASTTGRVCGTATVTTTSITVADTTLSKGQDSCMYTFVVRNAGDISAKLGTINTTKPSGCTSSGSTITCGTIQYKITTTNSFSGTAVSTSNVTVAGGADKTLYLHVKNTAASGTTSTTAEYSNVGYTLVFNQN